MIVDLPEVIVKVRRQMREKESGRDRLAEHLDRISLRKIVIAELANSFLHYRERGIDLA